MRLKTVLAVPALFGGLALCAFCQTLPQGVQKKASLAGITEYEYPNGLRVLLYPDDASATLTVNIIYMVGSRHEGYGETGMAHLLEHMNFIKTTTGREVKKELVDHGANWNGTTSYDRTNYYETVPATDENLRWALGLEADRMVNIRQEKEILDTEMTVVRNEFERGENSPASILEERVLSTAYLWHNYGKSTIGAREDIEKVPIDRLAAFYHKYYQPDNAVLALAGKMDPSKALAMVAETLGRIPKPTRKLDQTYTVEPPQDGERYVELRRVGAGQTLIIAYHGPAAAHADSLALEALSGVMNGSGGGRGGAGGGATNGRLYKALVETKKAQSASMSVENLHDPGVVIVNARLTKDQSIDEVRKIIYETIDGVVTNPPTAEEVDAIKTRLTRALEQQMGDAQRVGMAMTTPVSQGDWRLLFLNYNRTKAVTAQDVVRVAKTYFKASNRTVGVYIPDTAPERTVVPATPDLEATLRDFKTDISVRRGEAFDPNPAAIEKRVVRAKLSNGMKLAMLRKETANARVTANIELHFGNAASLNGKNAAAQYAGSQLMSGTKTKTRQQIQDAMQKLNAQISVSGGGGGAIGGGRGGRGGAPAGGGGLASATATVSAPVENFEAALRLAAEIFREPVYPEAEFERSKAQRVATLAEPQTEPEQLSSEMLSRHLSPFAKTDTLYSPTREEQLEANRKVTLDDARKFHDAFYGANHGEFAIVGPFDQAAVQKLAEELFGKWNSPAPYARMVTPYKAAPAVNQKIETPDKANAQFLAGARLKLNDASPDYPALVLASYMLGGSITARLPNRIRNLEGLSYTVNASISIPSEGDAASFSALAIANPGNVPKAEACFKEEMAKAIKDGFTAAEVTAAKKAYQDARTLTRSQDTGLLSLLAAREQLGRTLQWDADLDARIQALTPEQISAALRKNIDLAAISIVKAGDFKAAGVFQK
jgi:zinc protease